MNIFSRTGMVFFFLIPFTLCFWERGSTLFLFLYGLTVVLQPSLASRMKIALSHIWILPFLLLFGFTALSLLWSGDMVRGGFILEKKTALAALPILLAVDTHFSRKHAEMAMLSLGAGCLLALWIAVGLACLSYFEGDGASVFFYHRLGWKLDEFNAAYFSFYVFMSIAFFDGLIRNKAFSFFSPVLIRVVIWVTLGMGIILLSSRLFIFLSIVFGTVRLAETSRVNAEGRARRKRFVLVFGMLVLGVSAILINRSRFQDIASTQFEVLQQDQFSWDTPFNGLTLRMLLLKFGWEALQENQAVFQGVGVGDVRSEINKLILKYNLYHGNPELGDMGYLDYSLHNQYMETWLQAGLPALAAWLWILAFGWRRAVVERCHSPLFWLMLAITAFSFFESTMERQRGIVFMVFFLSVFYSKSTYEDPKVSIGGSDA